MSISLNNTLYNIDSLINEFTRIYFSTSNASGFQSLLHLYHQKSTCVINGKHYDGMYDFMIDILNHGIINIFYNVTHTSYSQIDDNKILICVSGICRGLTTLNCYTEIKNFSDSFIIEKKSSPNLSHDNNQFIFSNQTEGLFITHHISNIY